MGFLGISGSTWKKIGKIALKAAPIVAAPFTGGASLLALGAGTGALSGALSGGGWKGALIGGGLGAIPGGGTSSALTGGIKAAVPGLAKGALTNFATGTATGLATGQGLKSSLAGGGTSALSGFGTTGTGGVGQAAKTIGKNTATNVGGAYAARGLQAAGVPGVVANEGGNVFSNYLGKQMTPTSSLPDNPYDFADTGPAASSPGLSSYLPRGGSSFWPTSSGAGGTSPGGGGTTAPADPNRPPTWAERYGPLIFQGAGVVGGALVGKKAQQNAMIRSPEEQTALTGAQGAAGQAGQLGTQLGQQGRDYLQKPGQYFQTLLGGNRAAMSQAVAGPTAQLTGIYRGAQRNLDQQGVRGAARDVASGDLNRDRASKLAGLTTGVQPYAAEQLAKMGTDTVGQAGNLLASSGNIYGNLLGAGYQNRVYARKEGADTAKAIGGLVRDASETVFKRPQAGGTPAPKTTKPKAGAATSPSAPTSYPLPTPVQGLPSNLPGGWQSPNISPPGSYPLPTPVQGLPSNYPFSTGDYNPYGNG